MIEMLKLPQVLQVKEMRVLTTKQLAEMYGTDPKTIQYNFRYNKSKYILGKHYIEVQGEELRRLKTRSEFHSSLKYAKSLYLWTEKGALLHAKSLNTDQAWKVYDYLVDFYFRAKENGSENLKKEVVPTKTKTEPVKNRIAIPHMEEPIFVFKNLLMLAEENGILVKMKEIYGYDSILRGKRIAINQDMCFDKVIYEVAYELAHYFIHYENGNLINTPLEKEYNTQAERAACMMIRMLDIKAKQKY